MRCALESFLRLQGSSMTKSPTFVLSKLPSLEALVDCGVLASRDLDSCTPPSHGKVGASRGFVGGLLVDDSCGKKHTERKIIGYSQEQIFDVVSSVEHYQQFVPWCVKSTVIRRTKNYAEAELEVGFQLFVERYISKITMERPHMISTVTDESTIFHHLKSDWRFEPGPTPATCSLYFHVDFQFKSQLYRQVASVFFDEVVKKMLGALERRCEVVYGPSSMIRSRSPQKIATS